VVTTLDPPRNRKGMFGRSSLSARQEGIADCESSHGRLMSSSVKEQDIRTISNSTGLLPEALPKNQGIP